MNLGDSRQAKQASEKTLAVARTLARTHPQVVDYQARLANVRCNWACALSMQGEHNRAAAEIESAVADLESTVGRPVPEMGLPLFNGACGYCQCATAARKDSHLPKAEQETLAERYLDLAMHLLGKAEKTGFFRQAQHLSMLQRDHDLDRLRLRPEFKKLQTESEAAHPPNGEAKKP